MSNTHHLTADIPGERLDTFLSRMLPDHSRSYWQKLCEQGMVTLDGREVKSSFKLKEADTIAVIIPEQPNFAQQTLPILYEDDDVLVINKPTGILTHAKGAISDEFTVAEFVRPRTTDGVETNRPGIVHRLDRDTSGIIITAKHTDAKHWLQKQFSERKVKKAYVALLEGHLKEASATVDLPIERNPRKPQTFRVNANGKPAQTLYETEQIFLKHTLVRFRPLTGRTHQLRVHAAYLGHPIVGDPFYGKPDKVLGRTFLHAAELEITLPCRERKVFHAPLATDLAHYLNALQ